MKTCLVSIAALVAASGLAQGQVVNDGSFEASGPVPPGSWTQFSTNFGTPLCNGECIGAGSPTEARTGQWWAWFGGIDTAVEVGSLTQSITIPAGTAQLEFYMVGFTERTDGTDFIRAQIDGNTVWTVTDQTLGPYTLDYTLVSININAYAGGTHILKIDSVTNGGNLLTNFWIDDVVIVTGGTGGCYANCDQIGGLTGNDFQCFLNAYVANLAYANCDGVGGLTGNDFQCFLDKYVAGCT